MSHEGGGYWAKLGDRYEGRWVVLQLLLLLHERITSVTVESVGGDEAGVDLWIERRDRVREAQQCKVGNGVKDKWSFADLDSREVLDYAKRQLKRDPSHQYSLVSSVPAVAWNDLSRNARDSSGNSESFYENQIIGRGKHILRSFRELSERLGLNADNAKGRAEAFDFLRRTWFHLYSDDQESREYLFLLSQLAVDGNPEHVVNALANFATNNPRKPIGAADVFNELARLGLPSRRLVNDPRVTARIDELNNEFHDSIEPNLAAGQLIHRDESEALLSVIDSETVGDVVLHGEAGQGKSGVLYELTEALRKRSIPFLAIRLDRKRQKSARQFGLSLELPESPSRSLHEIAAGSRCIWILDQLDALRWTNADSADGLDVCKSIVREVMTLRSLGSRISLVLSCRSFDLEHDPQIRDWLKPSPNRSFQRVPVSELPDAAVKKVVEAQKLDYGLLNSRQQRLLKTINNLAMWADIVTSDKRSPDFGSTTQLLRAYCNNRRRCIQSSGITAAALKAGLDALVDHMESTASLSAPVRLIEYDAELTTELQSWGVIRVADRTVSFAHQSQLDFLIADRVLASLGTEADAVVKWLGDRSQMSLFRCEQLRQVLMLLIDENQTRLLQATKAILNSSTVRFHLKQVALEVLGQAELSAGVTSYIMTRLDDDEWKEHFESEVLATNPQCFRTLVNCGALQRWLDASDERPRRIAFWLMRTHRDACEDIVMSVCTPLVERGRDWARHVFAVLPHEVPRDSQLSFRLRVKCILAGSGATYVGWKELVGAHPARAIRLFAALFEAEYDSPDDDSVRTRHYGYREDPSLGELRRAAAVAPRLTTRLLLPIYVRYVRRRYTEIRRRLKEGENRYAAQRQASGVPGSLARTLGAALCQLAKRDARQFLRMTQRIEGLAGQRTRRLLVDSYSQLPIEYAEVSLTWLLADKRRLTCGNAPRSPRWLAARRLIRRMSPHCSDALFWELEDVLMRYVDPEELRHSKFCLEYVRHGHYDNNIGRTQLHLLPALSSARRASATTGRIGVLQRKFGSNGKGLFVRQGPRGGMVRSAIAERSVYRMSDNAWLRVISSKRVPDERSARSHRFLKHGVIESSIEQFAANLGAATERAPDRFAKLALEIPDEADPRYLAAIFGGLECHQAPNSTPDNEKAAWRPATPEAIDAVLCRPLKLTDFGQARRFCWLLLKRKDLTISDKLIDDLCHCCRHVDPPKDQLHVNCNVRAKNGSVHDLETNALNCVRGCAALAIASILYDHPQRLDRLRPSIENLLNDPHPAVRVAAVDICLPVWNVDKDLAIEWFTKATNGDPRVAACREALRLYNHAFPRFAVALEPVIREMVQSERGDVAESGAHQAAARWVFHGLFEKEIAACIVGTAFQRQGVALALSRIAHHQRSLRKCANILLRLAADEDEKVRRQVQSLFLYDDFFDIDGASEFLSDYVNTRSFNEDPSPIVHCLERHKGTLTAYWNSMSVIIRALLSAWNANENRSIRFDWAATHHIVPLTLRLYEQTRENSIRDACLDFWDEMLRLRICTGAELAKTLRS